LTEEPSAHGGLSVGRRYVVMPACFLARTRLTLAAILSSGSYQTRLFSEEDPMARHVFAAACFLCLTASVGRGQITNVTNDQSTPIQGAGHDYIKMLSETVNPANGSVSVRL